MSSPDRQKRSAPPPIFGSKPHAWGTKVLLKAWRFVDRPVLITMVIICVLAVGSRYQVDLISPFGEFRFEPVREVQLLCRDWVFSRDCQSAHSAEEIVEQAKTL